MNPSPVFSKKRNSGRCLDPESCREKLKLALCVAGWTGAVCVLGCCPGLKTEKWVGHWTHFLVELGWVGHVMFCISVGPWKTSAVQPVSCLVFAYFQRGWLVPKYWKWARPGANLLVTQGKLPNVKSHVFLFEFLWILKEKPTVYLLSIAKKSCITCAKPLNIQVGNISCWAF